MVPFDPAGQLAPGDPAQMMDGLMAELAARNPGLAKMYQFMAMQRQAAPAPIIEGTDDQVEALRAELAEAHARLVEFANANRALATELDAAMDRVADAAAIVGACGLCWGEDPRCRSCRGRGTPGRFGCPGSGRPGFFAEPADAGHPAPAGP